MTSGTDPKGNQISYVYDKNYQQVKATDAKGNTITYKYDSMGRVIEESNKDFGTKLYEYDKAGNLKKYTDGNGNATVSKFDSLGQVLQSKDAVGNITKYEYDALGNETKITYGDGSSHSKEYDNCGRLAKETDELGAVTTYTYDAADNLVSKSDDSGRTWTYTYDNTGNRLSETNPEGGTTTYTYDKAGNLVSSTDEEGRTDTYAYDKAGNLTTSKDALGYTVSMKYDLNGNLVSSTDENGNTSTMTYDGNGNMTSVSDAKGNITAMKYDSTDNLEQTVDALKGKTTYEYDSYRELLIADLKSDGLIEKKKVVMTKSAAVEKMLTNSLGKCNSIRDIVFHEYEASGQDLRLLVLTDYIRKEYEKAIGNTEYDVNSLGVLPFFEMLRRDNEKKNEQIRFGVLCGTIVIIPAEAREALEQAIGMSGKVTFSRIGNLSETDYLKVTAVGNAHFLTGAVTDIFSKGYMQVLIGTKSLLGEGWDSPCINSLILASFVGSFMLSNQMRGRAIRVMKEHPEKTSNIWHLVCLRPWNEVLKADDNQISEDYSMLERRMEHFLGLHYTENTIENGMKRLSVIKTPFNKTNIDRINRQMLKMSGQRDTLKERWNSALAVYDKMDIVDETEVKDKFVTSVVFWDAILTMILSGILCLIGAIGAGIVAAASQNGILAGTCYFFIAAGLAGIMIRFPKIFMLGSPLKRLKAFGNGIRKALEEQQLLEETHCKVETESNGPDNHIIYLSGGSGRDKALFAQCVNEFFDVIDNQRYILVKKKGHKGLNGFYAIPNCFSKKKEDAERFAKCMHPYIGNYDCVYTRNEKGRELLLEGRVKALANREERCISHKKVKGALE